MLLTVKKQIEETLEVKTPCYYRGLTGFSHINEAGEFTQVSSRMINMWMPSDGKYHADQIENMLTYSKPCTKEEFDTAFVEAMDKMKVAVGLVEVNS
jgi:hypothetical protein